MKDALSTTGERLLGLAGRLFKPPLQGLQVEMSAALDVLAIDLDARQARMFAPFTGSAAVREYSLQDEDPFLPASPPPRSYSELYGPAHWRPMTGETLPGFTQPREQAGTREHAHFLRTGQAQDEHSSPSMSSTPTPARIAASGPAVQDEVVFPALATVFRAMTGLGMPPSQPANGVSPLPPTSASHPEIFPPLEPVAVRGFAVARDLYIAAAQPSQNGSAPDEGRTTSPARVAPVRDTERPLQASSANAIMPPGEPRMRMAQGAPGIAALLAANLTRTGAPQEVAPPNVEGDNAPLEQDRNPSDQSDDYRIEALMERLVDELEFEYIRFYGTSGR